MVTHILHCTPRWHCVIQWFLTLLSFSPIVVFAAKRSPKRLKYTTHRFIKEGLFLSVEVDPLLMYENWNLLIDL